MSSRRNGLLAGGILFGFIAIAVALVMLRPEPPRTEPPSRIPEVQTATARTVNGPLTVRGSGTVRARAEVALAPQVGGRVEWQATALVRGGLVRADEVLLRIEAADYENAVRQAEAVVAESRVVLLQAEEEARIARDEFRRFAEREGISMDSASPLTLREPQLQAAQAQLARAEAQLADARLALARTEVTAPFDGVVVNESVDVGNLAQPGAPVATLYASDAVEVAVPLADGAAGLLPGLWDLRAGDADRRLAARIHSEFGGRTWVWDGYVDRAQAALDPETRTIDVILRVPNPFDSGRPAFAGEGMSDDRDAPPLLVGEFVDVEVDGVAGEWRVVPRRALQTGNEVWMVTAEDRISIVPVEVLQRTDDDVWVRGDLPAEARVVVAGITLATEGMDVRPAPGSDR